MKRTPGALEQRRRQRRSAALRLVTSCVRVECRKGTIRCQDLHFTSGVRNHKQRIVVTQCHAQNGEIPKLILMFFPSSWATGYPVAAASAAAPFRGSESFCRRAVPFWGEGKLIYPHHRSRSRAPIENHRELRRTCARPMCLARYFRPMSTLRYVARSSINWKNTQTSAMGISISV